MCKVLAVPGMRSQYARIVSMSKGRHDNNNQVLISDRFLDVMCGAL